MRKNLLSWNERESRAESEARMPNDSNHHDSKRFCFPRFLVQCSERSIGTANICVFSTLFHRFVLKNFCFTFYVSGCRIFVASLRHRRRSRSNSHLKKMLGSLSQFAARIGPNKTLFISLRLFAYSASCRNCFHIVLSRNTLSHSVWCVCVRRVYRGVSVVIIFLKYICKWLRLSGICFQLFLLSTVCNTDWLCVLPK